MVLEGDLWIVGHGDPEIDGVDMADLAPSPRRHRPQRVHGRVIGATGPFAGTGYAPGWRDYFPDYYIALPTALRSGSTSGRADATSPTPSAWPARAPRRS